MKNSVCLRPCSAVVLVTLFLQLVFVGMAQAGTENAAKTLLWEIKSPTNTLYIFGSIHLAKPDFYPLPRVVEAAYKQADVLAVEVDASDPQAMKIALPLLMYKAPDRLENHISKESWQKLSTLAGSAAEQFQPLKPAVVTTGLVLGLMKRKGYTAEAGIDLHFIARAKADGKALKELENIAFQAHVLGDLSDEEGESMLKQALDGLVNGEAENEVDALVLAWKNGDASALAAVMQKSADKDAGSAKVMKLLLDDRNVGMAEKIGDMLDAGQKAFIVIGAGHMTGKNSILALLKKRGLQVRQLP